MKKLESVINYNFKNINILNEALTHSSYANEAKDKNVLSNERLEFLGDSVLSLVVSQYIFNAYKDIPEGELTTLRSSLVCEKSLFEFAKQINLGNYLLLSKGERNSGGAKRASILADAFEALIAAIFLDGGLNMARNFIIKFIKPEISNKNTGTFKDYKTTLQEIIQKNPDEHLEYHLAGEKGPDHNKHFTVEVHLNNNVIGKGGGKSKKEAEQEAARESLELMGY